MLWGKNTSFFFFFFVLLRTILRCTVVVLVLHERGTYAYSTLLPHAPTPRVVHTLNRTSVATALDTGQTVLVVVNSAKIWKMATFVIHVEIQ